MWASAAQAGPNLVANGDLNHTDQDADVRIGYGERAAYFTFDGDAHFGRVVATTTGSASAMRSDLRVAYVELGKAPTGGQRGLLIDTSNLKGQGNHDISIWFDLNGEIRPEAEYEWKVEAAVSGAGRDATQGFKLIAPALWADGEALGAEVDLAIDGRGLPMSGSTRVGSFQQQTGPAAMVLGLPSGFNGQFLVFQMALCERDLALLKGEPPPMPVPVRYITLGDPLEFRIAEALHKSADYLRGLQDSDTGAWETGDQEESVRLTSMVVSALAEMGRPTGEGPLAEAMEWLAEQLPEELEDEEEADNLVKRLERDLQHTETHAWRLYCLCRYGNPIGDPKHRQAVAHDIIWLEGAQFDDGGWATHHHESDDARILHSDNDSSALAVAALREAFFAGKPCSRVVWLDAARYWVAAQATDGGYRGKKDEYGGVSEDTTVTRTAAGVASLLGTLDMAFAADQQDCQRFRRSRGQLRALRDGFGWLDARYQGAALFGSSLEYRVDSVATGGWNPFASAFYLQRLGNISGRHRFGGLDHFRESARLLLDHFYDRQRAQFGGDSSLTAWTLVTLSAVDSPTVLQRIVLGGDEGHQVARDAEHLVRYLARQRKRSLNWRWTSIDRPMEELVLVPMLYLNCAGPGDWSTAQWNKLRDYCFAGGVVLINIAEDNESARGEIESALGTLFPEYHLQELPDDAPVLTLRHDLDLRRRPKVIGNGIKSFVFLLPEDWSCAWHTYQHGDQEDYFALLDNLLEYTMDGEPLPGTFVSSHWKESAEASREVAVDRLELGSEVPAYPDCIKVLDRAMRAGYRTAVKDASELSEAPVLLWVASVGNEPLTAEQQARIRRALQERTYLLGEVIGGDEERAETFAGQLQELDPRLTIRKLPTAHPVFTGRIRGTLGFDVTRTRLSRTLRKQLSASSHYDVEYGRCDLYRLEIDGREVGTLSKYDLSGGLHFVRYPHCRGPVPPSGREMVMNVILHALSRTIH